MKIIVVLASVLCALFVVCSGECPEDPKCPENMGGYPELLPVPWDCHQYILCDNDGVAHYMPCPDGLVFNPKKKVCDHPKLYPCEPCKKEDSKKS